MAVKNQLANKTTKTTNEITYMVNNEEVKLTPQIVRQYLVNGNADKVTSQEIAYFLHLCKAQKLNPFVKEAYLVKYGNSNAQTIISKDAFLKRAELNEFYDGFESGVIVYNGQDVIYRKGAFYLKGKEELVGAWCDVYKKNISHAFRTEVNFDEYVGRKSDGSITTMWANKPATMIRKVAVAQALRDAFPNNMSQLYISEEMNVDESTIDKEPVIIDNEKEYSKATYVVDTQETIDEAPRVDDEFEDVEQISLI